MTAIRSSLSSWKRQAGASDAPAGSIAGPVALGLAVLLLAGSLSPLKFAWNAPGALQLGAIGRPVGPLADIVTNILIYIPLGLTFGVWLRDRVRVGAVTLSATLLATMVSTLAEWLQTAVPVRTASWLDVGLNAGGAFLGAVAVIPFLLVSRLLLGAARRAARERPMSACAVVLAVGLVVLMLSPFDFVTRTDELHRSLAASRWLPGVDWAAGGDARLAVDLCVAFAGVGFFLALAGRERGVVRRLALEQAVLHVILLSVVLETAQLFVASHVFDVADVVLNGTCGALGGLFAIYAVDGPSRSSWMGRPGVVFSPVLLTMALGLLALGVWAEAAWSVLVEPGSPAGHVVWIPFSAYYGRPLPAVLGQTVGTMAAAGLVATVAAMLLRHRSDLARSLGVTSIAVVVVAARETLQYFGTGHVADVTDPLLALAAALTVIVIWQRLQLHRPAAARVVAGGDRRQD